MDFSVMFFSSAEAPRGSRYDLLFDAARFADERGFCGIWIPERFTRSGASSPTRR